MQTLLTKNIEQYTEPPPLPHTHRANFAKVTAKVSRVKQTHFLTTQKQYFLQTERCFLFLNCHKPYPPGSPNPMLEAPDGDYHNRGFNLLSFLGVGKCEFSVTCHSVEGNVRAVSACRYQTRVTPAYWRGHRCWHGVTRLAVWRIHHDPQGVITEAAQAPSARLTSDGTTLVTDSVPFVFAR